MISKATILIAVCLVFFGYRWGKRKAQARSAPPPVQPAPAADTPKKEWISVKALLLIVAVLLVIAILSSLGGKIG